MISIVNNDYHDGNDDLFRDSAEWRMVLFPAGGITKGYILCIDLAI